MGFLSSLGNIAKKAAPIAGGLLGTALLPGVGTALGGSIGKMVGGKAGGMIGGAISKGANFLGQNGDKILGAAGAIGSMQDRSAAQKMQNQGLQMAQQDYANRAPIRQAQQQMLLAAPQAREDLSKTYGSVSRGAAIPGQGSQALGDVTNRTNDAVTSVANFRGVTPFRGVAATDGSDYNRLAGKAEGEFDGARLGGKMDIAGTDLTAARQGLGDARANVDEARIGEYGSIAGTDTRQASRFLNQAAGRTAGLGYEDFEEIEAGTYGPSRQARQARNYSSSALRDVAEGTDRAAIANDTLAMFGESESKRLEKERQATGQKAAALGRLGAGMTTNDLTDLDLASQDRMNTMKRTLANDVASQTLSDRQSILGATLGAEGQYTDEDISNAGMSQSMRNEARGERDFAAGRDTQRVGLEMEKAGMERGLSSDALGLATTRRNDQVSERDFALASDSTRAQLALSRGSAISGLAGQEAGFAGMERADRESDRSYNLDYDSRAADLSLARGDRMQGLGSQSFNNAATLRGEDRLERSAQLDNELSDLGARTQALGAISGLEGQRYSQEAGYRDEDRAERGYGDSRSDLSTDRRIAQRNQEEDLLNSSEGRRQALISQLGAAGGQMPADLMLGLGADRMADANEGMASAGQLLGRTQAARPRATTGIGKLPTGRVATTTTRRAPTMPVLNTQLRPALGR